MNIDPGTVDYAALHAAARRERAIALHRYVVAPIAAFFRRLARPEARKPAAVFPAVRGC